MCAKVFFVVLAKMFLNGFLVNIRQACSCQLWPQFIERCKSRGYSTCVAVKEVKDGEGMTISMEDPQCLMRRPSGTGASEFYMYAGVVTGLFRVRYGNVFKEIVQVN